MNDGKKENKVTDTLFKIPIFKKLKNIKHIEIIICIIFIGLLLLIYFFGFNNKTTSTKETVQESSYTYVSSLKYATEMEDKLCKVIGNLKGVGNVSVIVRVDDSSELIIAKTVEEQNSSTNSNEKTVTIASTPIIVTENGESKPIILSESLPKILGVLVVASGADDVGVKLNIVRAIETITDIPSENIQVFAGK